MVSWMARRRISRIWPISRAKLGWRSIIWFTTLAEIFITSRSLLAAMVTALGSPENRLISPKNSPLLSESNSISSPVSRRANIVACPVTIINSSLSSWPWRITFSPAAKCCRAMPEVEVVWLLSSRLIGT